jgi:hypothetical protein
MICSRYRDALGSHAAGAPAGSSLEVHLEGCAECQAELTKLRQALALADQALASLSSVTPRAGFEARLRAAVEAAATTHARRPTWWLPGLAAGAAVLVGSFLLVPRPARQMAEVVHAPVAIVASPVPESRPPAEIASGRAVAVETSRVASTASAPRRQARRHPEPEVLVPPGEMHALMQWVSLVNREQRVPTLFAAADAAVGQHAMTNIEIRPIEFVPLDSAMSPGT